MSTAPIPFSDASRNRLPTLFEILSRRTLPPVDLFSFYIYMRDQQRSVDYLDFWLDVAQHMSFCKLYVRELRRSVLVQTPEGEQASKLSGFAAENDANSSMYPTDQDREQDAKTSAFLREDQSHEAPTSAPAPGTPQDSISPHNGISRREIRASAEKILYTFLLPGAEREITLPGSITQDVTTAIEEFGRDDPEVFDVAKDYVFQAMERDALPGFLRMKALGNLIPPTLVMRLIIGLVAMFGAFWTAFVLIFLDRSRAERCWVILPFTIGVYFLASYQYCLDPIMALIGVSEYTPFTYAKILEPFVRRLLAKRALMVLGVTLLVDAALCLLFILVPGKRL